MAVYEYTLASEGTFPNNKVDIPSFIEEIQASAITATLVSVTVVEGNCVIEFATDLSAAEVLILNGLVQAHTAIGTGETHMAPFIWQMKNPTAGQAQVKMNIMGFANVLDQWSFMRSGTVVGMTILAKNALTAGSLTIWLGKNGAATALNKVVDSTDGRRKMVVIRPGRFTFEKGDRVGVFYACSADMLPTADNEIDVTLEVMWT